MTLDTSDRPITLSAEALLRYFVLGQVDSLIREGTRPSRAVREVARREHNCIDGATCRVSARSIQRWRLAFRTGGLPGLEPKARPRTERSEVLPPALLDFLVDEKQKDPRASVPELLRRARERDVLAPGLAVDRTTVWRACKRMGLSMRQRPSKNEADARRYAYPHRMECILCDGKHFRAGAGRLRRVALFFLDDATRYAMQVVVGTFEDTDLFLRGLYDLVCHHGLMDRVYLDHGPGFVSSDTTCVVQLGLKAWLIHGRKAYPQGHGKIEKFNQTALHAVLRGFDGAADVDPAPGALELRLRHFLRNYNARPHESLQHDTPQMRWEQSSRALRFPDNEIDLRRRFIVTETRKVSADHVIKFGSKLWETPRGTSNRKIEVYRNALDGDLHVTHQGKRVRLHELDVHANARDRRGYPGDDQPSPDEGVPTTAATLAFQRDFGPVTGPDGGFTDPQED